MSSIQLIPVEGLPEISPGDDLGGLIAARAPHARHDVVVIAQKVVSKAEGRLVHLGDVVATDEARAIAPRLIARPDPRVVQVVLDESVRVLRSERVLITETRHGYVCANAGVDHSNIPGDDTLALLPLDPDESARQIRTRLRELTGIDIGVIVSDTFGRAWRVGIVNVALGVAGVHTVVDLRGRRDDAGKELHATVLAIADDVAAAAGLLMGKTRRVPAVVVRGVRMAGHGAGRELIRPPDEDLFR